jgi:hypothetical protein
MRHIQDSRQSEERPLLSAFARRMSRNERLPGLFQARGGRFRLARSILNWRWQLQFQLAAYKDSA